MSINEAYSMFLTHEDIWKSTNSTVNKEVKLNYMANIGNNQKNTRNNVGWNTNSQANWIGNYVNKNGNSSWNKNFNNEGGYGSRKGEYMGQGSGNK